MAGQAQNIKNKKNIAYEKIKKMIRDGHFRADEPLVERQLSAKLGLSRTPVREALRTLTSEGLLETIEGKGIFLREVNLRELMELYELRQALESYAIYLFVQRASEEDIQRLRNLYEDGKKALLDGDFAQFIQRDMQFHVQIARQSKNQLLYQTINQKYVQIHLMAVSAQDDPDLCQSASVQHTRIIEAVERRDQKDSFTQMWNHIQWVKTYHQNRFYLYR